MTRDRAVDRVRPGLEQDLAGVGRVAGGGELETGEGLVGEGERVTGCARVPDQVDAGDGVEVVRLERGVRLGLDVERRDRVAGWRWWTGRRGARCRLARSEAREPGRADEEQQTGGEHRERRRAQA